MTGPAPRAPRPGRIAGAVIFGIVGVAILLWLGAWQVQRLAWKEDLIARIEAGLTAEPVAVPADPEPGRDGLLRVTATGRIDGDELHALGSLRPWGVGYRVISPMTLSDGRRVMVDLGFVPEAQKDPANRQPLAAPGPASDTGSDPDTGSGVEAEAVTEAVTGVLLWPRETDSFTAQPDIGRNIWFARDVDAMAAALDTAPVLIVAQSHQRGDWPRPMPPGLDIPNRHLEYAITWFGLAAVWAAMTVLWIRTELRGPASRTR